MGELSEEKRFYILSELAYAQLFNTPKDAETFIGYTLGELTEKFSIENIKADGGLGQSDLEEMFYQIQLDPMLSSLIFTNYENNNASENYDGFVAYSFKDFDCNAYFAFRGSECDTPEGQHDGFLGVDWLDNYTLCVEGKSRQFEDIKSFVSVNSTGSGRIYVTGHSKGGANALYACSQFENSTGMTFDAPGIDQAIYDQDKERLKSSGITNYVASDDKIGALLFHSENRIFCKMNETYSFQSQKGRIPVTNYNKGEGQDFLTDTFIPHALQAFYWNSNNELVEAGRSKESMIAEALTQSIYDWNVKNGRPLDKDLTWVIENKNKLKTESVIKALEGLLEKAIESGRAGREMIFEKLTIDTFLVDKDIAEILGEALEKYSVLDNIQGKILSSIKTAENNVEKGAETLYEEIVKDLGRVEVAATNMISRE